MSESSLAEERAARGVRVAATGSGAEQAATALAAQRFGHGWLRPGFGPDEERLEDALHDMVCGLTAIEGSLVRPRWQPKPPATPAADVDWCAVGIVGETAPGGLAWHEGGATRLEVYETLTVMCSFYGPRARVLARALRDGLWVEQNRAMLRESANLALVRVGDIVQAHELVNNRWLARQDVTLTLSRGPWPGTGSEEEGRLDIKDIAAVQACGLCGRSR